MKRADRTEPHNFMPAAPAQPHHAASQLGLIFVSTRKNVFKKKKKNRQKRYVKEKTILAFCILY